MKNEHSRNLYYNHRILSEYCPIEKGSFNLKNNSSLWASRKLCDLSIDSIKSRPSFSLTIPANVSHFDVCNLFFLFLSLHPRWQARKEEWALCHFVSWTVICIIRGLSTGFHEQWCRCIMKMRTDSRERSWYSYHAPLVHYRCSNTFFKRRLRRNRVTPLIFLPDILTHVSSSPKKWKTKKY